MDEQLPVIEFAFPGPLRDRLVSAIRTGRKTATSSLLHEYEVGNEPLPAVGDRGAVIDSNGERVETIETTAVRIVPLRDVPLGHALAEGEGYATVADWRLGHTEFWSSEAMRAELGDDFEITDSSLVVLEQFILAR
ncbi:ASCH domain-containing protein [Arthrobacter sp. ISL-95]|uniref:ASCH domain-containing protein n=1 Tax=Arthrobacter sp. ISL-95 TaxID=2819116 RepID=UPI001BEB2346|nr:ASCH domain-containing protein [Arthrobacter sp. ISL-95]MBT2587053.1 ASCH domain-containing protein [Arthrobacter sp. ISL-95]